MPSIKKKSSNQRANMIIAITGTMLVILIIGSALILMKKQAFIGGDDNTTISDVASLKPQVVNGDVTKRLEKFVLTDKQGVKYHLFDPNHIVDQFARKKGVQSNFYDMEGVNVKGLVDSGSGYGYMGSYDHQITVLSIEEE